MVVLDYELKLISFSINLRPRQMPEYTKVGLKLLAASQQGGNHCQSAGTALIQA